MTKTKAFYKTIIVLLILYAVSAIIFFIVEPKSKYSLLNFTGAAYFFIIFTIARLTYFIPLKGFQVLIPIIPALYLIWGAVTANFHDGLFYSVFCGLSISIDVWMFFNLRKTIAE
jgi:hypothetical protein